MAKFRAGSQKIGFLMIHDLTIELSGYFNRTVGAIHITHHNFIEFFHRIQYPFQKIVLNYKSE